MCLDKTSVPKPCMNCYQLRLRMELFFFKDIILTTGLPIFKDIPSHVSPSDFNLRVNILNSCSICTGNEEMTDIIIDSNIKNETKLFNVSCSDVVAYVHKNVIHSVSNFTSTLGLCENCKQHSAKLTRTCMKQKKTGSRVNRQNKSATSKVPIYKLTESEKDERIINLSKALKTMRSKAHLNLPNVD